MRLFVDGFPLVGNLLRAKLAYPLDAFRPGRIGDDKEARENVVNWFNQADTTCPVLDMQRVARQRGHDKA